MKHIGIFLKNLLRGRGVYASFMVIAGWSYLAIIIVILSFQIFLLIFRIKCNDKKFEEEVKKNRDR